MLLLKNITLIRGNRRILDELNLSVKPAEIHSILGVNGTGKSTLAYAIMGLPEYKIQSGKILFNGKDIAALNMTERAKLGITLAWQEPARFEGITVYEYLMLAQRDKQEKIMPAECLTKVGLDEKRYLFREIDDTLSGGERKRIELAAILAQRPKLAILDEPDSGIDALSFEQIKDVILTLAANGSSVILITHHEQMAAIADRSSVLCAGKILKTSIPEEVTRFFRNHCQPCTHVNQPEIEVVKND